jgi:hypothetical protein
MSSLRGPSRGLQTRKRRCVSYGTDHSIAGRCDRRAVEEFFGLSSIPMATVHIIVLAQEKTPQLGASSECPGCLPLQFVKLHAFNLISHLVQ